MCGRYSVGKSATQLAEELDASLAVSNIVPRYNVAPSQPAPMLVALPDRRLGLAVFGWNLQRKKGLLLNARSETAPTNGLFRTALERRRALIPADGFYEWKSRGEGRKGPKDAYYLHQAGALITFAGLYYVEREVREDAEAPTKKASFVIMTTAASREVAPVHDRMPVIVPPELRSAWLDVREPALDLLADLGRRDPHLELRQVSSRVGSPANDDPSLHEPAP